MSYKLSGRIKKIFDTQTFPSGFSKREFVVTTQEEKYPQDISIECLKDKESLLNGYKVNDAVTVHFDIRGREYNERFFVSLAAWKIERGSGEPAADEGDFIPEDTNDYSVEKGDPF